MFQNEIVFSFLCLWMTVLSFLKPIFRTTQTALSAVIESYRSTYLSSHIRLTYDSTILCIRKHFSVNCYQSLPLDGVSWKIKWFFFVRQMILMKVLVSEEFKVLWLVPILFQKMAVPYSKNAHWIQRICLEMNSKNVFFFHNPNVNAKIHKSKIANSLWKGRCTCQREKT